MRLTLPHRDRLVPLLRSGILPPSWLTRPVTIVAGIEDSLSIVWSKSFPEPADTDLLGNETPSKSEWNWEPLTTTARRDLRRLGIVVDAKRNGKSVEEGKPFPHLLAAVPLVPVRLPTKKLGPETALWVADDDAALAIIMGELVRLGVSRQQMMLVEAQADPVTNSPSDNDEESDIEPCSASETSGLVRVVDPPVYALLATRDGLFSGVTVYRETAPRRFVPWGFDHPVADLFEPRADEWWLLDPDGWRVIRPVRTRTFEDVAKIANIAPTTELVPRADALQLHVPVRLVRTGGDQPVTLWVLRGDFLPRLEAFLREAASEVVDQLSFAITEAASQKGEESFRDGNQQIAPITANPAVAVLRSRPGRGLPPVLTIDAEGYAISARQSRAVSALPNSARTRPAARDVGGTVRP